ncbi:hypothetical protein J7337_006926 [Fusarium musae]|uniref:Transcription factor domain-containing protein n=1 Tax=Fusarium musae TaxID=1042133 RepID=A0A9P8DFY3_9HYPO|nr:hypothetical protein J7337_006926 [Fusarium musae]KAG9501242.1 hypothetical protein J7337_006926 [Fusarium musae]
MHAELASERKIDTIDRRLEALTELMRDMKMNMSSTSTQPNQNHMPSSDVPRQSPAQASSSTPYGHLAQQTADSPVIEGESSLAAHGEFANEFLKNAVGTESLQGASLELRETLDSLHHIVSSLKQQTAATEMSYPHARQLPRPSLKNNELPPIQTAVALIRECETENSEVSAWIREFFSMESFSGMCLHVYFSEDVSEADIILVNVGLMYMFMDRQQRTADAKEQEECEGYMKTLRENTETALGRASTIQDWDVTVPLLTSNPPNATPLSAFICLWVATARCQGHIYELLYSPDSMTKSDDVRRFRAQKLVNDLKDISRRSKELSKSREKEVKTNLGEYFFDFILISDDVLRLSLLTLIYRATPGPPNSKSVLRLRVQHYIAIKIAWISWDGIILSIFLLTFIGEHTNDMVSWGNADMIRTLLFAPFIPFIVVFCQVIETQDQTDLARLHSFCTSLETTIQLSDAAAKTYRLFQVLYTVALRYIEFRTSTPPADQTQASAELNNYLAALGFPPAGLDNGVQQSAHMDPSQAGAFSQPLGDMSMLDGADGQRGANTMMWMGNTAQLGEWFNSSQQMMELLEEPSFTFPQ